MWKFNVASFILYKNTKINFQYHLKNQNFNQNNYKIIKKFLVYNDMKFDSGIADKMYS